MFGLDTLAWKLIGGIAVALALAASIHLAKYWHGQASDARARVAAVCDSAKRAADNPRLDCKRDLAEQVRQLGDGLKAATGALDRQTAALTALEKRTAEQQRDAAQASQEARQRAKGAADVSADLRASARAPERAAKPCEPSKALQEAWHG